MRARKGTWKSFLSIKEIAEVMADKTSDETLEIALKNAPELLKYLSQQHDNKAYGMIHKPHNPFAASGPRVEATLKIFVNEIAGIKK